MGEILNFTPASTIDNNTRVNDLSIGPWIIPGRFPDNLAAFLKNYENAFAYLGKAPQNPEFVASSRALLVRNLTIQLAIFQDRLSDHNHYDQGLKNGSINSRASAAENQLARPEVSPADMYNRFLQGNLSAEDRVICKDFATFTTRIFQSLGFNASTSIIGAGIGHMFTVAQDPKTGLMYFITAEGAGNTGAKVFEGKTEEELREKYQAYLLTVGGRAGNSFGGAIFDANGKFTGYAQTAWEKAHSEMVLGGTDPSRLLQTPGTGVVDSRGTAGAVDYATSVATYKQIRKGKYIDMKTFLTLAQSQIKVGDSTTTTITDARIGASLQTKDYVMDGFKARVFMATDAVISTGIDPNGEILGPELRGNSVIGGHLEYKSEKWSFTTDAGKSYELLNPSQYSPTFKQLSSGEFVMIAGKYEGEGVDVFLTFNKLSQNHT